MVLRNVEVSKATKGLNSRDYPSYIDRVRLEFLAPSSPDRIVINTTIARGIGVVTGGNGAGKSTLIRGLRHLEKLNNSGWPDRLASIAATGMHEGARWDYSVERNADGELEVSNAGSSEPPQFVFIDPVEDSMTFRSILSKDPHAEDRLEGIDAAALDDETLAHARRVLRRDYDSISYYEVELDDDSADGVFPWFSIRAHGTTYDLRSAGRGELAALYLLWRISRVPDSSIVVIDEPEAGLAAYSQSKLKESLAYLSVKRGIQFVVTTHSPDLYLGLPEDSVTVLESLPTPASRGPMAPRTAAQHLGARAGGRVAVFTEDAIAASLVTAIISLFDRSWLEAVEVFYSRNGESALSKLNEEFIDGDHRNRKIRLMTVFDGDQRPAAEGPDSPATRSLYLPGNEAPEESLREIVVPLLSTLDDSELRSFGAMNPDSVRMALDAASGSDHHDWFIEVAREFSDYESACNFLVQVASRDTGFNVAAKALFDSIVLRAGA